MNRDSLNNIKYKNNNNIPTDFKFDVLKNVFVPVYSEHATENLNNVSNSSISNDKLSKVESSDSGEDQFGFVKDNLNLMQKNDTNNNNESLDDDDDDMLYNKYIKILSGEVIDEYPNLQNSMKVKGEYKDTDDLDQ